MRLVETKLHPDAEAGSLSDEAIAVTATMVGAVMLARLAEDPELARRILEAARRSSL